jgi:RNase H-fold protein (predicted Holliday junction resolvase)
MFLVRDIMFCKPGQARPMVEKFQKLSKVMKQMGMGPMRVMTDFTAERFWTVIAETEVSDLAEYTKQSRQASDSKETREIMQGYHDIVESGRREIYVIEQ